MPHFPGGHGSHRDPPTHDDDVIGFFNCVLPKRLRRAAGKHEGLWLWRGGLCRSNEVALCLLGLLGQD